MAWDVGMPIPCESVVVSASACARCRDAQFVHSNGPDDGYLRGDIYQGYPHVHSHALGIDPPRHAEGHAEGPHGKRHEGYVDAYSDVGGPSGYPAPTGEGWRDHDAQLVALRGGAPRSAHNVF